MELLGDPTTSTRSQSRVELAHGVLAVLGGVADVVVAWALDRGKPRFQCIDDAAGVVDRKRGLRGVGEVVRLADLERGDVIEVLDQMDVAGAGLAVPLPHRAFDFRMSGMADQHHVAAGAALARDFQVHLGHQRTGRVEHLQPATRGLAAHRLRHAVRAEDDRRAVGHFVEFLDEDRAAVLELVDHVAVVHDFVAHVDRRAERSSARLTISIARSTPAQKPRGLARMMSMR